MLISFYTKELKIRLGYLLISYLLTGVAIYLNGLDLIAVLCYHYGITKNLYYTNILTPYILSLRLSAYLSFFIIHPLILIEIYYYLSPSLYKLEQFNLRAQLCLNVLGIFLIIGLVGHLLGYLVTINETQVIKIYYKLEDLVDVYLTLLISLTIMLLVGSTLLPIKNRKTYLFINLLAASLATPPEIKSLMLTLISVCALLESLTLLRVLKVEYIKEKVKSGVDSR
jgi:Sec-independent protein secretion pathway component TatC